MTAARALALSIAALAALPAAAEEASSFGCARLAEAKPIAFVEGAEGTFYRLNPDLRTFHPLSQLSAALIGDLSAALEARGTRLIYVPLPPKSLAMPDRLPEVAGEYGYDTGLARAAYDHFVETMRAGGVTTVDALAAMDAADDDTPPYVPVDFHWSSSGAHAVAKAVAETISTEPSYADVEKTEYETTSTGPVSYPSKMRQQVQSHCRQTVPAAETPGFATERTTTSSASGGIFAEESDGPPLALVGTSMSETPAFNFAGFLADASRLEVANYAIAGGNQFGSIVSFILSEDFQSGPPAFLVWENPVYNNLGDFGAHPMRELLAAVTNDCQPLETGAPDPNTLTAELPDGALGDASFLRADTGRATGREAVFRYTTADGLEAEATVRRLPRQSPTRWFYQENAALWPADYDRVTVTLDRPASEGAQLSICTTKESRS